jgi:hypothetical protein
MSKPITVKGVRVSKGLLKIMREAKADIEANKPKTKETPKPPSRPIKWFRYSYDKKLHAFRMTSDSDTARRQPQALCGFRLGSNVDAFNLNYPPSDTCCNKCGIVWAKLEGGND